MGKIIYNKAFTDEVKVPIFTAATGGTTNDYNLDGKRYRSHTFTSNGTFEVTTVGNGDRNKVDYLIIAGGGGSLSGDGISGGAGGGAGGYRTTLGTSGRNSSPESKVTVTATSYSVTVGSGGTAATNGGANVVSSSVAFPTTISCVGGGGTNPISGTVGVSVGKDGGSGGGAGAEFAQSVLLSGGNGTAAEGFDGSLGRGNFGVSNAAGGGGGGAGGNGIQQADTTTGGIGGVGLANLLRTGSNETRAVGGNGQGSGTTGGGANGTANTGNGGTGSGSGAGGNGGAGVVIIRYEIAPSV
jgi:hypothetical protein